MAASDLEAYRAPFGCVVVELDRQVERREFLKLMGAFLAGIPMNRIMPEGLVRREPRFESTVLMYHELSAARLKRDLLYLTRRGYQPISLETLIGLLNGETKIPPGQRTFHVTCDDGLASQFNPVFQAMGDIQGETGLFVPVTFFVITKFEDPRGPIEEVPDDTPSYSDRVHRYMTKGQLIHLIQAGYRIENHTVNHPDLTRLSQGARNAEVEIGEQRIEALWRLAGVPRKHRAFAYPYGRYRDQTEYIRNLYDVAFSTIATTTHSLSTRYILGRRAGVPS